MSELEIIQNAIDSNGFVTETATYAGYVNPTYWNKQLLSFLEARLVVANMAKVYNDLLDQDGSSLKVTVDTAPTAAAAVADTDDVTVAAWTLATQVTFTPTEYAKAFALSDKEARRSFVNAMENMTRKIGYALALNRDSVAITTLVAGAGTTTGVNGHDVSNLASSDTLDFATLVTAVTAMRANKLIPKALVLSPGGIGALSQLAQFVQVQQAGSDETLREGKIGRIYGLDVYWTTQISPSSSKTKGLLIGQDQLGEPCFGIAMKANPTIRTQRFELGRYTNIVGVEEWDIQILRANGIGVVYYYSTN